MKTLAKRILSIALALCLFLNVLPAIAMQVEAADSISMVVSYAQARVGKTGQQLGYTDQWCAFFVCDCAAYAGQSEAIPRHGNAHNLYFLVLEAGGYEVTSPRKGDLVFYNCTACDTNGDGISMMHVGLVENESYTIEGNLDGSSYLTRTVKRKGINERYSHSSSHSTDNYVRRVFVRPNYSGISSKHTVDSSYGTNFSAYPIAKITAENIFNEYHSQIDSTSWIGTSDKCTIHEVYTDGCCKVTYPLDAGGTKTVYSKISLFNTHTHDYSGARVYQSAHPHEITQRCVDYATCGGWKYTGEYYEVKTCEQCWHADFDIGQSSVSVKIGESKTIALSLSGCLPDSAVAYTSFSPDNGVAEVIIQNKQATFTGLKEGLTYFRIYVYSDSSKSYLIDAVSIQVDVASPTYTIYYNANGGSGAPSSQTKTYGVNLTLSSTKPTREGYTFLGWATSSTATSASYQPGGSYTANDGATLYAVWKKGCEGGNHSYSYTVTTKPTVSATGKLTGTCSKCSGTTTVTLPKLSTTDYSYKVTKAATCTAAGTGRYTWKTTTYGSFYFDVSIAKLGNSYTAKVTAPTCTAQGYTTHTCSRCTDSYKDTYTSATGHSYSYKASKAPTTSATGALTGTCSKCSGTTTVTLPKLNTTDYTYKVTKEPSYSATGTGRYTWKTTTYGSFYFNITLDKLTTNAKYSITSASGVVGSTVEVYVAIENNPGIISLRNTISYDTSALELIEVKDMGLLAGYTTPSATLTSPYTVRWADSLATANNMANGRIVKLTFKITDDAESGEYLVRVTHVESRNVSGSKVTFAEGSAYITVFDYLIGDVDNDGEVTDWDAILLNRYLAGWGTEINLHAADVDGDGEVSDWDAILLERYLAGWDIQLES